jgi:DNA-binding HxlR family transcriptional regulator
MSEIFRALEKSKSIEILIALYDEDRLFLSKLLKKLQTKDTNTINRRINALKDVGLVKDKGEAKFGGRRYIWLTEKGKKVAGFLADIEKIMKNR